MSSIEVDKRIQQRAGHVDQRLVEEYALALESGAKFPPVVVFGLGAASKKTPAKLWLADGFHRVLAHQQAVRDKVDAELREGGEREAILYACGANAEHGMRRTHEDKRRAVETLLRDEEWGARSDRWVADTAKVSPTFVGKVRAELAPEPVKPTVHVDSQPAEPRKVTITREPDDDEIAAVVAELAKVEMPKPAAFRTGRDGRTTNTGRIGKKRGSKPTPAATPAPTAAQAQQAAARFAGTVSDLRAVVDKLTAPEVSRLANLAAGVLGDLLERLEGADAQAVVDELQERVEAVWKEDGDA